MFAMVFHASYDGATKIISAVTFVVLFGVALVTRNMFIGGFFALILLVCYGYSPKGYEISGEQIIVRRLFGDVQISPGGDCHARVATSDDLAGSIRLLGNGGVFGYYGLFRTSRLGKCTWYVTNRAKMVVVRGEKTILFSPDDVGEFIAAVQSTRPEHSAQSDLNGA